MQIKYNTMYTIFYKLEVSKREKREREREREREISAAAVYTLHLSWYNGVLL